jgi:hypothetical protein
MKDRQKKVAVKKRVSHLSSQQFLIRIFIKEEEEDFIF